jgi:hypothetical protein
MRIVCIICTVYDWLPADLNAPLQAALAAARSAFTAAIEFADAASQAGAWAAAVAQLQVAFEGLLERIKRQEAERQVSFQSLKPQPQVQTLETN